jgi:Rps23 Pro-64 3,4-dihydroxylase Tpa1-like proline 4-hydroxylase
MNRNEIKRLILAKLDSARDDVRKQWNSPTGTRTRHFFVDDLLPADLAAAIYAAFPRDGDGFFNRETFREKKRTSASLSQYDQILGEITYAIQDVEVVSSVERLVGSSHLEPDPTLYAGGLSMMFKGDFLNPHVDNSHDAARQKFRRLNLLYYVSPDWSLACGGNLELWDDGVKTPKTIVAKCNRLVVMETNKSSWHSVSPVVSDNPRCLVSNYFFSQVSPDGSDYFHVTSFTGRPGEKMKRTLGVIDNYLRNVVAKLFKLGRGKDLMNK